MDLIAKGKEFLQDLPAIEALLASQDVINSPKRLKELGQQHAYLKKIEALVEQTEASSLDIETMKQWLSEETDAATQLQLREELKAKQNLYDISVEQLQLQLIPPDPQDNATTLLELRAGAGGDEAALFVGDCVRMYRLFAAKMGWKVETLSFTPSDVGGYKEYVISISGEQAHRYLQHEAGVHRIQRVPATESQGRLHTSTITVAALIEPEEDTELVIDEKEIRIDTQRASGAGGQHVNTTDSAVRITHLPTGIVVYCQAERSQKKNRDMAMRWLHAKLAAKQAQEKAEAFSNVRSGQVGGGMRSERIRTYNAPQCRVTDHRISWSGSYIKVLEGELEMLSQALIMAQATL